MTIEEAIKSSKTMAEAARKVDMPFMTFKRKAAKMGLYEPNQSGRGTKKRYNGKHFLTEDILAGKHSSYGTAKVKKRLIEEGIMKCECAWCGITDTWNGKPIVLHLDHINGVNNDHRLENLRLLCPNCHSQTDTYAGKGKRK